MMWYEMKMKRMNAVIWLGGMLLLGGGGPAHAGEIGSASHVEGSVTVRADSAVALEIEQPKATMLADAVDGATISAIHVTPTEDAFPWVRFSKTANDRMGLAEAKAMGETLELWWKGDDWYSQDAGDGSPGWLRIPKHEVKAGHTMTQTIVYHAVPGMHPRAGEYIYGVDAGLWTN